MYRTNKPDYFPSGARDNDFVLKRVDTRANISWSDATDEIIWLLARKKELLTSEDVRAAIVKQYPDTEEKELRALGPVMLRAAKHGWIEKHSFSTYQGRSRHGAPCRVWRSKILVMTAVDSN